jgi:branched-subunit amino acid aminotransferase/4-amino-4-deoxychorismate lyase
VFEEGELGMIDVSNADEIFLTSSMRGVQSAVMMRSGSEAVGAVTNRLSELYHKRVREELGL